MTTIAPPIPTPTVNAGNGASSSMMRALVYHGAENKAWEEVPKPVLIDDTDAIVRVDATTICGSDLHILKGDVPAVTDGRILGHLIDGTQAEFVRVPFADTSTYPVPDGASDEEILMLADILPTGYEVGVLNGRVQPGDVVAIVGAGPIGLSAIMGARLFNPSHIVAIDLADSRLAAATFELATTLIRPCGHVANIGVHGKPATLHLETLWIRDVTITTGLVDTYSTPTLLRLATGSQIDASKFITHHFAMDDMLEAYDTFARANDTGALKVVITPGDQPKA